MPPGCVDPVVTGHRPLQMRQRHSAGPEEYRTAYCGAANNHMLAFSDFSRGDQDKLDAMLRLLSRRAGHTSTIEDLVARWAAFVDELQAGHEFSASDYREGLELRGILEELGEGLSERGRQTLIRVLLRPDRLFLALTVPVNGGLSCAWWQRYPQSMAQKLHGGALPRSGVGLRSRLVRVV
jgi:hypothetical protein